MFTRAARSLPRLCAPAVCLLVVAVCASPAFSATGSAAGTPTLFAAFPSFASAAVDLTGSNFARPTFARTITWNVTKSVDRAGQNVPLGGSATFDYTVTVTHDDGAGTDSGWQVTGEITVFNPNDAAVNDVAVSDAIDDPNATCVVSDGSSTIPGAGHITFDYACTYSAAPDAVNETSTALISWPAQTLANLDSLPAGSVPAETAVVWDNPFVLNGSVDVGDSLVGSLASLSYTDPSPTTFTYPYTFDDNPPGTCTSYDNTAAVENDAAVLASDSVKVEVCSAAPTCTGQKVNVRWHYSANGSSGSWSGTKSTTCDGSALTIGPQAMEGDLKLAPGTTLTAGYDFTIPGNNTTLTLTFNNPRVVFALRCVSGAGPSQSTLTVPMSTTTSTVKDSAWYPSGDQHSPLVYQGSVTVPNVCAGGQVRLDKGGTFTTSVTGSGMGGAAG